MKFWREHCAGCIRRNTRRIFFSVDRRECLEKVKSVSTARFTPAGLWYNLFKGEVRGGVASIKMGRMLPGPRHDWSVAKFDRRNTPRDSNVMRQGGPLPSPHTHIPLPLSLSSLVDKRELRLQQFSSGSLLAELWVADCFLVQLQVIYFAMANATIFFMPLFFTRERERERKTMPLNTISLSTYATINFKYRAVSYVTSLFI